MTGWIKVDSSIADNKKFYALQETLGMPDHEVVGGLVMFWAWCFNNSPDGILSEVHRKSIGRALRIKDGGKWFEAMIAAGFIDELETGEFSIHDWFQWGGTLHRYREKDRERKVKTPIPLEVRRKSSGIPKKSTLRGEEKRGEEIREETPSRPAAQPDKKRRPRDETFDFLALEFQIDPEVQGSRIGKLSSQFKKLLSKTGAGTDEIKRRRANYRAKWPNAADTAEALVKHWGNLDVKQEDTHERYERMHRENQAIIAAARNARGGAGRDNQILVGCGPELAGAPDRQESDFECPGME